MMSGAGGGLGGGGGGGGNGDGVNNNANATASCLEGCSVFVTVTHSGGLNASAAFGTKVAGMGANVAKVLTKTVTHVVFKGDDAELRSLYDRASKVSPGHGLFHSSPPLSPLPISRSIFTTLPPSNS